MGLGGLISGIIAEGQSLPTPDLSALYETIKNAGANQRDLINALPANIQQQLAKYEADNAVTGAAYQGNVTGVGNDLLAKTAAIYGPNTDAANAEKLANKSAIYSTVPGSQEAIRGALAATGGLSRGHAGTALAQPYMQAAQQYGQSAMATDAAQTKAGQGATQQALQTVASMNDGMFTQLFGMSKAQAQQILTSGTQALQDQLSQLINQSATETNQKLSLEGIASNAGYQNAVTRNAQTLQTSGQLWDTGMSAVSPGGMAGGIFQGIMGGASNGNGMPSGTDVGSADYMRNASANAPW